MTSPPYYLGFVDAVSRWTQNLASSTWAIYTPSHTLVHFAHICIGPATNNQAEYDVVIVLLRNATHYHIPHLCVHLDSQLSVA